MKDIFIADLAGFDEGRTFDSFFLVLAKQQRTTKQNKPYLNLVLGDKTGQLEGRVWELGDPRIDEAAMSRGIAAARWPARFQRLDRGPLARRAAPADVWLDGAHNPHGAAALAQACASLSARDGRPVALVLGMLGRKDAKGYFEALRDLNPRVFTTGFSSPIAAPPEGLAEAALAADLRAGAVPGVEAGIDAALAAARAAGEAIPHIILCGSLHFAGDILSLDPATWPD